MPIYAYRCAACGHTKDVLRKLSDPPLAVCPACGAEAFEKQVTAAGFQLKGSGWYVTDFRNNNSGGGSKPAAAADGKEAAGKDTAGQDGGAVKGDTPAAAPAEKSAAAPAAAATPPSAGTSAT